VGFLIVTVLKIMWLKVFNCQIHMLPVNDFFAEQDCMMNCIPFFMEYSA